MANVSKVALSESIDASNLPRILPLTWTTMVVDERARAASSALGHGASSKSLVLPKLRHSVCVMCGAMGASAKVAVSRASRSTAKPNGVARSALNGLVGFATQGFLCVI